MPLVRVEEIYSWARQGGYGVAGFCAENLDIILSILEAAEEASAPVVIVLWDADIKSVGAGYLETIVKYGAIKSKVPVAFMLDHGTDKATCLQSILNGHSGVMIDASHESLEENIRLTREVCEIAHMVNVLVEGELGTVKRSFETTGPYSEETQLTEPRDVPRFVEETGVDAIAISIGTESGIPSHPPMIDFERIRKIATLTHTHLIIHGGSGIDGNDLGKAIQSGITAFRFASEIRVAYLETLEQARKVLPSNFPDTRLIYEPARNAARQVILTRMNQLGCSGKAW